MQSLSSAIASIDFAKLAEAQAAIDAKPAKASRSAKPAAEPAKPAEPAPAQSVTVAKPTTSDREAARAEARDTFHAARAAAARAVAEFYTGRSMPFKAATAKLTPLNPASRVCGASPRSAALLLALATYGSEAFNAAGEFQRGGFNVPARLVNPSAPDGATFRAKPEAGCLGDQRGRTVDYADDAGDNPDALIKLHVASAMRDITSAFGDAKATAFRDMLASYGVAEAIELRDAA
jgi:hypothetical protein